MPPLKFYKADLRMKYQKYMKISFIVSLLLVIAAFKFSPRPGKVENTTPINDEVIVLENPVQTTQKTAPPPMQKPVEPVITLDDVPEDLIMVDISIDEKEKFSIPPVLETKKLMDDEPIIFRKVEVKPEMIGGLKSLQEKIYYPDIIRRAEIEGKVVIEFIVDKDGNVSEAEVTQKVHSTLDVIALSAVKALKFKPGMQRGKPVKVKMKIPVIFKLK